MQRGHGEGGTIELTKRLWLRRARRYRTITLNRPERRNAMTPEMQMELIAALDELPQAVAACWCWLGPARRSAPGLDLSALQAMQGKSAAEHRADAERIARLFLRFIRTAHPNDCRSAWCGDRRRSRIGHASATLRWQRPLRNSVSPRCGSALCRRWCRLFSPCRLGKNGAAICS